MEETETWFVHYRAENGPKSIALCTSESGMSVRPHRFTWWVRIGFFMMECAVRSGSFLLITRLLSSLNVWTIFASEDRAAVQPQHTEFSVLLGWIFQWQESFLLKDNFQKSGPITWRIWMSLICHHLLECWALFYHKDCSVLVNFRFFCLFDKLKGHLFFFIFNSEKRKVLHKRQNWHRRDV